MCCDCELRTTKENYTSIALPYNAGSTGWADVYDCLRLYACMLIRGVCDSFVSLLGETIHGSYVT